TTCRRLDNKLRLSDLVWPHVLMFVEEEHGDLRRVEQFVNLRSTISFGHLCETVVACLTDPMSLVDKKEIEFHGRGISEAHVPGKDVFGAAKLRLKGRGKRFATSGMRRTVFLLQHLGEELHRDDGFPSPRSSANQHSAPLVLLLLTGNLRDNSVVCL